MCNLGFMFHRKKTKVSRQEATGDSTSELNRLATELGMRVQEFNQIEVRIELHLAGEAGAAGEDSCVEEGDLSREEEMARLEAALDFKLREIEALQRRLRDKQIVTSYGRSESKSRVFGSRRSALGTGSGPPATSGGRSDVTWDSAASQSSWRQRSLTPLSPTTSPQGEDLGRSPSEVTPASSRAGLSSGIGSLNHSWSSAISGDHRRRLVPLRAPGSAPEVSRKEPTGPERPPRCSSSPSVRTKAEH
ncbi:uncharacterized protein [Branchiostoma lanceolatum]|uniref:uncharacterized protein n=1 Tax=Branchiostoma lanceolatum TaxID=7740 RepID=UPI003456B464